jgi:hypothetical protein
MRAFRDTIARKNEFHWQSFSFPYSTLFISRAHISIFHIARTTGFLIRKNLSSKWPFVAYCEEDYDSRRR